VCTRRFRMFAQGGQAANGRPIVMVQQVPERAAASARRRLEASHKRCPVLEAERVREEEKAMEGRMEAVRIAAAEAAAIRERVVADLEMARARESLAKRESVLAMLQAADAQRLADERAEEQRLAAARKAVEIERLAAYKAAEEKRIAAEQAAEAERLAAEQAAEAERLEQERLRRPGPLMERGVTVAELREMGFSAKEVHFEAGVTPVQLLAAGFMMDELLAAGVALNECYTLEELMVMTEVGFTLRQTGYSAADLRAGGYGADVVRKGGFSAEEAHADGYSAAEMCAGGYSTLEAMDAMGAGELGKSAPPRSRSAPSLPPTAVQGAQCPGLQCPVPLPAVPTNGVAQLTQCPPSDYIQRARPVPTNYPLTA
jgi:hypothetical protein